VCVCVCVCVCGACAKTLNTRLWHKVSLGLQANDQTVATDEKFIIEDAQRKAVREREEKGIAYEPRFFKKDDTNQWIYKHFKFVVCAPL